MAVKSVYDIDGFVGLVGNTGRSDGPHAHIQYDARGGIWPGIGYLSFNTMDKYLRIGRDKNDFEGRRPSELKPPSQRNGTGRAGYNRGTYFHAGWDISNKSGKGGSIDGAPIRVINGAVLVKSSAKPGNYRGGLTAAGNNITIALPDCTRIKIMHLKEKSMARIGKDPCNNPIQPSDRTADNFGGDDRLTPSNRKINVTTKILKDYDESPRKEDEIEDDSILDLPEGSIDDYERESESSIFEEEDGFSSITPTGVVTPDSVISPSSAIIGNKRSLSILETNETEFLGQDAKEKTPASSEISEKVEDESVLKETEKRLSNKKEPLNINGSERVLFTSWVYDTVNKTDTDGIEFRGNISHHYLVEDGKLVYG